MTKLRSHKGQQPLLANSMAFNKGVAVQRVLPFKDVLPSREMPDLPDRI
jgi:hypothetical protein